MGRIYRVPYSGTLTAGSGDADVFLIRPASDKPCQLVGWILGQTSEIGDAAEEAIRLTLRHMTATLTVTGGTSVVGVARRPGTTEWVAAGFTATANHGTVTTTSGTSVIMEEMAWNIRSSPWERWFPEEYRPEAISGEGLILRMETTLADNVDFTGTLFVEEE